MTRHPDLPPLPLPPHRAETIWSRARAPARALAPALAPHIRPLVAAVAHMARESTAAPNADPAAIEPLRTIFGPKPSFRMTEQPPLRNHSI